MTLSASDAFALLTTQEKSNLLTVGETFLKWAGLLYVNPAVDPTWIDSILRSCRSIGSAEVASVFRAVFDEADDTTKIAMAKLLHAHGILSVETKDAMLLGLTNGDN